MSEVAAQTQRGLGSKSEAQKQCEMQDEIQCKTQGKTKYSGPSIEAKYWKGRSAIADVRLLLKMGLAIPVMDFRVANGWHLERKCFGGKVRPNNLAQVT